VVYWWRIVSVLEVSLEVEDERWVKFGVIHGGS